jgi:uncharacterized protein (DUF433 family)
MTKNNAESLMKELLEKTISEKYPEISADMVADIISISKDNRDRAKALKSLRKYMFEYFKELEND